MLEGEEIPGRSVSISERSDSSGDDKNGKKIYQPIYCSKRYQNLIKAELHLLANRQNLLLAMVFFLLTLDNFLVVLHAAENPINLSFKQIEGHCYIEELSKSNWTYDQKKNITSPSNGTASQSCYYYKLNYSFLATLSYKNALAFAKNVQHRSKVAKCYEYLYKDNVSLKSSIIREFDLMCDRPSVQSFIFFNMVGASLGTFFAGIAADTHGRRAVVIFGVFMVILAYCIILYTILVPGGKNLGLLILGKMVLSLGAMSTYLGLLIIFTELCRNNYRSCLTFLAHASCNFIPLANHILNSYIESWRLRTISIGCPFLIILYGIIFIPESPRWLMTKHQWKKTWDVLQAMGSKKEAPPLQGPKFRAGKAQQQFRIFGKVYFRQRTLISLTITSIAVLAYAIVVSTERQKTVTSTYVSTIPTPTIKMSVVVLASWVVLKRTKRCMCATGFVLMSAYFLIFVTTESAPLYSWMLLLTEVTSLMTIMITLIYVMEMFPTTHRGTALGVNSSFGSLISLFYLYYEFELVQGINILVLKGFFCGICAICALICALAPVTYEELPDVRDDVIKPLVISDNESDDAL